MPVKKLGDLEIHYKENGYRFVLDVLECEEYNFGGVFNKGNHYDVVVDLGANIGMFSIFAYDYADKIYAVEPIPLNVRYLRKNKEKNNLSKINIFEVGIAGESGRRSFESIDSDGGAKMAGPGNYKVMSMDDFFGENKINHVDLLKIDVEESEYEIFGSKGFEAVADKIDLIIGESHTLPEGGVSVRDSLTKLGFNITSGSSPRFVARRNK